jgi:hypothetical protein
MGGLPWSFAFSTRLRNGDRLCFDAAIVASRTFLGREGGQVDVLTNIQLLSGVETADEQDLVHELVELGDISLEFCFAFGMRSGELESEPDPGERRPQLMGRIGEQHLVRVDQAFDASGGLIEAPR